MYSPICLGNEAGRMIYDGDIIIGQRGKLVAVNKRFSFKSYNVLGTEIDFKNPAKTQVVALTDNKEKNEELDPGDFFGII